MTGPMQALLETIRRECRPGLWSQGVELVRVSAVSVETRSNDEVVTRVRMPGRAVAPTAILYPVDGEWTCDCGSSVDPCAHVAAAVIAISRADQTGVSLASSHEREGHIAYELRAERGYLALTRLLVAPDGTRSPLGESLASPAGRARLGIEPSHDDLHIDRLLLADRSPLFAGSRLASLLGALASCSDVRWGGSPVGVSIERITPQGRVFDDGNVVVLELVSNPRITSVVARGVVLLGETLHPLGETDLSGDRLERLPHRRTFAATALGELVGSLLPQLEKRIPLEIASTKLPRERCRLQPRIAVELFTLPGAVEVLPTLVYGDPAVARIDDGKLVQLGDEVPIRLTDRENDLVFNLRDELNLVPGRRARFDGVDAAQFVKRLEAWSARHDRRGGEPVARQNLTPRINVGSETLEVAFEVESSTTDAAPRAKTSDVLQAWQNGLDVVPLDTGGWASLPLAWLERHGTLLADILAARESDGKVASPARLLLAELCEALEQPVPVELSRLKQLLSGAGALPKPTLPGDLTATLRPYQHVGVAWLSLLQEAELGAILADDMGLGKTLQTICVLSRGSLVVCPRSVLHNWDREITRFRPQLHVTLYHGARRSLDDASDVTITTYGTLRQDIDQLTQRSWSTIVLDEAQNIKNPESQAAQAAFRLRAGFKVALSGTPVENRLDELFSILHFAVRGVVGGRARFRKEFAEPIAEGNQNAAQQLHARIRPFLLRRLKRDVLAELPARTDVMLPIELSEDERGIYETIRRSSQQAALALESGGSVMAALEALLRLRQAACHPGLLPGQATPTSSKVERLIEALDEAVSDGHKALVFSQWTSLLDLLEPALAAQGLQFSRLDGKTRDRAAVVETFQRDDGPPILLTSLKAGGTGLNLTAADHVFLMDPWWNPATEDQAADRAHRIGQQRPVVVYRLIARETVEERIVALQERKRGLADLAVSAADHGGGLNREELRDLLQ